VPVINLAKFCNIPVKERPKILIITEYNQHVQGFMVHSVDNIQRLAWEDVKAPPELITHQMGGLVTAVTELADHRLVMILDVEKVLAEIAHMDEDESEFKDLPKMEGEGITVLYADDSSVARHQVQRVLDHMGIIGLATTNGAEAWGHLLEIAAQANAEGRELHEVIQLVLTDVEMPEMDGYVLTRHIKEDARFEKIPVVMHSSLSAEANKVIGESVGADAYVPKFQPNELAATLKRLLHPDETHLKSA